MRWERMTSDQMQEAGRGGQPQDPQANDAGTPDAGTLDAGTRAEVIVVGLGPGRWEDLTIEAQGVLLRASAIVFRTLRHPTVEAFHAHRPQVALESFDALYDAAEGFAALYPH